MEGEKMLQAKNISYAYGDKTVLNQVSFQVEEGELLLVCGKTGCGKSTLLRLLKPELLTGEGQGMGEIYYEGMPLRKNQSEIGFVMQRPEQQAVTDFVWHELAFGLENQGVETLEIRRRVAEIAAYFDMEEWYEKPTDILSGGQLQQLILASVLVMGSRVLVLDEPTSRLDPIASGQFFEMLSRLRRELGLTVIISEHRLEELWSQASQVLYLTEGQVGAYGTPEAVAREIKAQKDPFLCALPVSVQIALERGADKTEEELPLSIAEGRHFLRRHKITREQAEQVVPRFSQTWRSSSKEVLKISHLQVSYEKKEVLSDVNLTVTAGSCVALVGSNAAGKSTLLRHVAGFFEEMQWDGTVELFGTRMTPRKKTDARIGYMPQDVTVLFSQETVFEEWMHYASYLGKQDMALPEYFLEPALQMRHPHDLSGGQQQLLGLEMVMLRAPKLLLLDEPTQGMDALTKRNFAERLAQYKKEGGTVVMATHDLVFAHMLADRVAMLFAGEVVAEEETEAFFNRNLFYTTPIKRLFAGYQGKE